MVRLGWDGIADAGRFQTTGGMGGVEGMGGVDAFVTAGDSSDAAME